MIRSKQLMIHRSMVESPAPSESEPVRLSCGRRTGPLPRLEWNRVST